MTDGGIEAVIILTALSFARQPSTPPTPPPLSFLLLSLHRREPGFVGLPEFSFQKLTCGPAFLEVRMAREKWRKKREGVGLGKGGNPRASVPGSLIF